MTPSASVVVTTYENPRALRQCGQALLALRPRPREVVVGDDGSGPETAAVLSELAAAAPFPVRHLRQERAGFRLARLRNLCLRALERPEYVILLDGDCVPHPRWLSDHLEAAEVGWFVQGLRAFVREPYTDSFRTDLLTILRFALRRHLYATHRGLPLRGRTVRDRDLHDTVGCNLAAFWSDIAAVNGFNEEIEGWGREDEEFCARLLHLGRSRKLLLRRAIVYHLDHPRAPRGDYARNTGVFEETRRTGRVRCPRGLTADPS